MMKCIVCHSQVIGKRIPLCDFCKSNPFRMEEARDIFAKNKSFNFLRRTYSRNFAEIPNVNSPEFWDEVLIKKRAIEEQSLITKDRIKTAIEMIKAQKGKLLDVGFGYGFVERSIPRDGFDLYGIEISRTAVEVIRKKVRGNFKTGSILKIPFQDKFFDVVLALEVLEHISPHNTFRAFSELKRVLKNGGVLVVSVPLNEGLETLFRKGLNPSGHVRVYTPELISTELKIAGFQVQKKRFLYAFKTLYRFKKVLQKTFLKNRWVPNNIIIVARKP